MVSVGPACVKARVSVSGKKMYEIDGIIASSPPLEGWWVEPTGVVREHGIKTNALTTSRPARPYSSNGGELMLWN